MRILFIIVLMSLSQEGWSQNLYQYYGNMAFQKYEARDFQGAISYGNRLIKMYPDSTLPYGFLGDCYAGMNNFEEAVKYFSKALELGDSNVIVLGARGHVYVKMKQYELAEADFRTGVRLYPLEVGFLLNLGILYNDIGRFEDTKLIVDPMGTFLPTYYEGYFIRGFANESLELYDTAIIDYKQLIELDSTDYRAQLRLAACYKALGRTTEMCETLKTCFEEAYIGGQEFHDWDCGTILNYTPMPPPQEYIPSEEILPPPQEEIREERTTPKTD